MVIVKGAVKEVSKGAAGISDSRATSDLVALAGPPPPPPAGAAVNVVPLPLASTPDASGDASYLKDNTCEAA